MPSSSTLIAVSGNNQTQVLDICSYQNDELVKFHEDNAFIKTKYHLYLIDLENDLENVSQNVISLYAKCRENKKKLVVVLEFGDEIKKEKVFYFQKLLNELGKQDPLHRLVITKDIYHEKGRKAASDLDREFLNILTSNSINISSKGNNYLYPLNIEDFVKALIKIFFLNSTSGKTYYLLGDSIKDLELAYLVKKIVIDEKPDYQINSTNENIPLDTESQNLSNTTQIELNWRPTKDLETSLRGLYHNNVLSDPETVDESPAETSPSKTHGRKIQALITLVKSKINHRFRQKPQNTNRTRKVLGITLASAAFLYLLIFGTFALSSYLGLTNLSSALNQMRQGNVERSVENIGRSNFYTDIAINIYWPIRPLVSLYSKNSDEEIHNLFTFTQYLKNSLENLQQSYVLADKIFRSFNDQSQKIDIQDETIALKTSLSQVYDNLSEIDIMSNSHKLPKSVEEKIKSEATFKQLPTIENQLSQSIKIINLLPAIAKSGETKNLGIIVQDQDEIRGLGGVVKYLIVITVQDTKIKEIKIYDQQDINNLNDGSVKAPDLIAMNTGNTSWKFRDMTYVPDFSQTAQYLSWYLQKVGNIKTDSMMAINKSFFERLIQEDKSIDVSGKKITNADLKTKIGETDNGVLRSVIDYYLGQYRDQKITLAQVGRAITSEMDNGNVYLWTNDQLLESSISTQPFSGVITPYRCHSSLANYPTCINQTTFLSESNFTVAPINPFIKRESVHKVSLFQDHSDHEYQLNYHYLSDLSVLNRDYRLVYQLYAPASSVLTSVNVDGQDLDIRTFPTQTYGQFVYYQIPIALSLNQDHTVMIKFTSPITLTSDISQTAYSITEIRQSGLTDQGMGLVINLPENAFASLVSSPVDTKPQQIFYRFPTKTYTFGLGLGLNK